MMKDRTKATKVDPMEDSTKIEIKVETSRDQTLEMILEEIKAIKISKDYLLVILTILLTLDS